MLFRDASVKLKVISYKLWYFLRKYIKSVAFGDTFTCNLSLITYNEDVFTSL